MPTFPRHLAPTIACLPRRAQLHGGAASLYSRQECRGRYEGNRKRLHISPGPPRRRDRQTRANRNGHGKSVWHCPSAERAAGRASGSQTPGLTAIGIDADGILPRLPAEHQGDRIPCRRLGLCVAALSSISPRMLVWPSAVCGVLLAGFGDASLVARRPAQSPPHPRRCQQSAQRSGQRHGFEAP